MTRDEAIGQYGSIRAAARATGIPESTLRSKFKQDDKKAPPPLPEHAHVPDATQMPASHIGEGGVTTRDAWAEHQKTGGVERYILTSAQNNAKADGAFLKNLEVMAQKVKAEILVSYCVYDKANYRGLTVPKGDTTEKRVWWDKATAQYACNTRVRLAPKLAFCGEFDLIATARVPLSGMESYCGGSSIIVPHNKLAMRMVESRKGESPKEMYTTGSVTERRFIQRKEGQLAHFHHVIGALLVEVLADGTFFVHHLNADEHGNFYWLEYQVADGLMYDDEDGVAAVVLGDIHHEKLDQDVWAVTRLEIIPALCPDTLVVHDLIDFESRNHHNIDDPLFRVKMEANGTKIADEIRAAGKFLEELECVNNDTEVIVVESNHHAALTKWLKTADWKDDPKNAEFYLSLALHLVRQRCGKSALSYGALEWAIRQYCGQRLDDTVFLKLDQSVEIQGIEVGIHGHVGPTGAIGSPASYRKLGFKTFTAHTHSPSIMDGCYTVGVMGKMDMGYNVGPNKWMHTHGIIYPNGKRAFVTIKNKKWRAPLW